MANDHLAKFQARYDRQLRAQLDEDSGVRAALDKLEERSSGFGFYTRRSLLSGALRLTPKMCPPVAEALTKCREATGYDGPIEVYVKPSPLFNAFCTKDPTGLVAIGLSSRLIEGFTQDELTFVVGHELGHVVFDHFGIPMPQTAIVEDMAGRIASRTNALNLYLWCRAAELSADRIGLLCVKDPQAAAGSFFKLASGLSASHISVDLEALSAQVDSMASAPSARADPRDSDDSLDAFNTHPYNPLRLRALTAFAKSALYREAIGKGGGLSAEELEQIIDADMALMEPTYLEEKTAQSGLMRRLLLAAGMHVAAANGEVVAAERDALKALLGADMAHDRLDPEEASRDLDDLITRAVAEVPIVARTRLVQHLTIIAAADGVVDEAERDAMHGLAHRLGVRLEVIEETLAGAARPMD